MFNVGVDATFFDSHIPSCLQTAAVVEAVGLQNYNTGAVPANARGGKQT